MTNDLIQDVENALREDRVKALWNEYGTAILAGAALAVLLSGSLSFYRSWRDKVAESGTVAISQAVDAKDQADALEKILPGLRPGQRAVAGFTRAGILMRDGKKDEALKQYAALAGDAATPAPYRDLALWLSVRLGWSMNHAEPEAQLAKLRPLIDAAGVWSRQARVESALIAAHGLHDYAKALDYLAPVLSGGAEDDPVRQRARALDHVYRLQQGAAASGGAGQGEAHD